MCLKPAFPGEFENIVSCFPTKSGRGWSELSPGLSKRSLTVGYFFSLPVRSPRGRFTSGITNTSWALLKKTPTPSYRSCFHVYIGYPRTIGTSKYLNRKTPRRAARKLYLGRHATLSLSAWQLKERLQRKLYVRHLSIEIHLTSHRQHTSLLAFGAHTRAAQALSCHALRVVTH